MMKIGISWAICLIWSSTIYSQEFDYEASMESAISNGFHKTILTGELLGKASINLSDLRIYDEDGIEQPYLIQRESSLSTNSLFKEYKIVKREGENDSTSFLVFLNDDDQPIDNVSFIVQNTAVNKTARLSGSYDGKNWYVIRNNYLLQSMHSTEKTTELKMLDFPLSDYYFFKLEIDDNIKEPINILKVGYYERQKTIGLSSSFDYPIMSQTDSSNISFIRLNLPDVRYLEKLRFEISGAEYYSRFVRILIKGESVNRQKEKVNSLEQIASFELNSDSNNEIEFGGIRVLELFIEIENKDNRPLLVKHITGSFLNCYAVVYLEVDKTYLIKFGNEKLRAPDYDIAYFKDKIPENAQKLNLTEIRNLTDAIDTKEKEPNVFDSRFAIWALIALVGILLGLISFSMIKELKDRN